MKKWILFIGIIFLVSCAEKKESTKSNEKNPVLGEYVYVDRINVIHTKHGCSAVYKEKSMQSVIPFSKKDLKFIYMPEVGMNVCSQCVSDKQIQQLDSVYSSDSYINRRWMYDNVHSYYSDIDSWKDFNIIIEDDNRRLRLYNNEKDKYDLGTYRDFCLNMGCLPPSCDLGE